MLRGCLHPFLPARCLGWLAGAHGGNVCCYLTRLKAVNAREATLYPLMYSAYGADTLVTFTNIKAVSHAGTLTTLFPLVPVAPGFQAEYPDSRLEED